MFGIFGLSFADIGNFTQEAAYIGPSLWIFSTGISLIILFLLAAIYFWYKARLRAIIGDGKDVADLAQRKELLQSEIERCDEWIKTSREELLRLDAERKQQEELRTELANLQGQVAQNQQKTDDLSRESQAIQSAVIALTQDKDALVKEKDSLQGQIQQLKTDVERDTKESARVSEALQKVKEELDQNTLRQKEAREQLTVLLKGVTEAEIRNQSLTIEVSAKQEQLKRIEAEINEATNQLLKLKHEIAPLEKTLADVNKAKSDLDRLYEQKEQAERIVRELNRQKIDGEEYLKDIKKQEETLKRRVDNLRGDYGDEDERYRDLVEVKPPCLAETLFTGSRNDEEEISVLNRLQDVLRGQGIIFNDRVIKGFHTSLKINSINPLTVLAGVSGTGKTLLPIKYAEVLGMHSLVVSVQPRWDSPHDLFGFYNYLEHRYKATDLARSLVRMDQYNFPYIEDALEDRMLLVLLDEMNLARVEYYFSEFLSKLELRRNIKDPKNQDHRSKAEIEFEIGPQNGTKKFNRVWVGNNVLFVGTMNEDESTQTLSDKVLDRANVLRFGKPPHGVSGTPNNVQSNRNNTFLKYSSWNQWVKEAKASDVWDEPVMKWINALNNALEMVGRPFGHRVQQSIRDYVANYPGVKVGQEFKKAFADQVEQKVIPKLRGVDINDAGNALGLIGEVITELDDDELFEAYDKASKNSNDLFVWRGVTRIG